MIVFLKKVRVKTIFSTFEPVKVEPLELIYLKTILDEIGIESYIIDELFKLNLPKDTIPDVIVLAGYNVAENEIIKQAKDYKKIYPNTKIIVGGVHIQLNPLDFHKKGIDYVFHSPSLATFKKLIENIKNNDKRIIDKGVDTFVEEGYFHIGNKQWISQKEDVIPNRDIFKEISHKFRYLEKRQVALIKGSVGCPYNCSYCFCKEINNNHYIKSDYKKMAEEMEKIDAKYFWIVDDVLFADRKNALDFIDAISKSNVKGKIIGYLRADFILRERDLLPKLNEVGLVEIIVGFEATNNEELKGYSKTTDALDYPEVISLLKENSIDLTALFMVQPDYTFRDFRSLNYFIKKNKIEVFTISILTPIKGTANYERSKESLITKDPRKFDFLHLVFKPRLPKWIFYLLFYCIHLRMLKSKRVWKYILKK